MKSEQDLQERIEAYLRGEMDTEERADFERFRQENSDIDHQVVAHTEFIKTLEGLGERNKLIAKMNAIHAGIDVEILKDEVVPAKAKIKQLWQKYRMNFSVAASVAVFAVFSTILTLSFFSRNHTANSHFSDLRREINKIKKSQNALIKNIREDLSEPLADPSKFGGTGFALSQDGYIVTNFHVVKGAEAISVQNHEGQSYKVKVIHSDPTYDIAVLKITDTAFKALNSLPYTFKRSLSDISEDVYTIGYPKDQPVYGRGYLSSNTGYLGDTIQYQVSIDANLGNSGSPLFDREGNIIGVIKGKDPETEGAAFAVKSGYLLKAIEAIAPDSLVEKLILNRKNSLSGLSRKDQVKKIQDYIFMVKVY